MRTILLVCIAGLAERVQFRTEETTQDAEESDATYGRNLARVRRNKLASNSRERDPDQTSLENCAWSTDYFTNNGLEFLGDVDLWNQPQWLDPVVTDQGFLIDSMYGLFTPNTNSQKL